MTQGFPALLFTVSYTQQTEHIITGKNNTVVLVNEIVSGIPEAVSCMARFWNIAAYSLGA